MLKKSLGEQCINPNSRLGLRAVCSTKYVSPCFKFRYRIKKQELQ